VKAFLIAERAQTYTDNDDLQIKLVNKMNEAHGVESYYVNEIPDKLAVGCVMKGCHFALYFKRFKNIYKYTKGYTSHSINKHGRSPNNK
jgi:hypothetical protein